jgi:YafQ family addiction module toxin component
MPLKYDTSDELEDILCKLHKKERPIYEAILKKIDEISSRDIESIEFYKNLQHGMSDYKRVHIMKHFVLLFKVYRKENFILFDKFDHHDKIYNRKK